MYRAFFNQSKFTISTARNHFNNIFPKIKYTPPWWGDWKRGWRFINWNVISYIWSELLLWFKQLCTDYQLKRYKKLLMYSTYTCDSNLVWRVTKECSNFIAIEISNGLSELSTEWYKSLVGYTECSKN